MELTFQEIRWPAEAERTAEFLSANAWPFHGVPQLSSSAAASIRVAGEDVRTFWIRNGDSTIGIIRLLDLDDVVDGSPLFDLRIAERWRGQGVGRSAVRWLTSYLFSTYPELHRIEATTRHDSVAMQAVFDHCSYRLEGRMVEAWTNADGTRSDTLSYAILRREHE